MSTRVTPGTLLAIAAALVLSGCSSVAGKPSSEGAVNFEGLEAIKSRYFDIALVRPGVDFAAYSGLMVGIPELAFRTPDRSQQEFPLSDAQKSRFQALLASQFDTELAQLQRLRLFDEAGPDVLRLKIRVQDINATIPPSAVGRVGRAGGFLLAAGEATLVLELYDSRSGEVLARVADVRAVEGAAMLQKDGGAVTTWSEIEELCEHWAITARERLDRLVNRP
jgi:hypothetical protein